ncbi:MAG: NrfD/PsrC family molybdoenzyme membrane anchor subunit [Gemmatimonadales bacterium]
MPDTFFTSSPHWAWYIILYFFVGGIAGGAFFLASLLHLFGRPEDRPVIRLGYYVACVGAVVSGALLTLDLTKPLRFWHMLIESNTGAPMFKAWSPMSVGAWGLLLFGLFAFLAAAGAAAEEGRLSWRPLGWRWVRALGRGAPAQAIAVAGSLFGFFLAGYTGVLLAVTNRPLWADSQLLGVLFLFSGASTGTAALVLLSVWRGGSHPASLRWLTRFDRGALVLELLALAAFVVSLGSVARVLLGWWGAVLLLGVVSAGIVVPLVLESRVHGERTLVRAASLVLTGGLLLRMVVILSSEQIHTAGAGVTLP